MDHCHHHQPRCRSPLSLVTQVRKHLFVIIDPFSRFIMSVAQRLKSFWAMNKEDEGVSLELVQSMSLEELSQEAIMFGKAHRGKPFPLVFDNFQPWVDWFVGTYESSTKPAHQKFIRYVELCLESEVPTVQHQQRAKAKALPKKGYPAAAKSMAKSSENPAILAADWEEEEFEMMSSHASMIDVQEELEHVRFENRQMSSRMAQLEMSMQEMIQHLQKLTVKSEV